MNLTTIKQRINNRLDESVGDARLNDFINSIYFRIASDSRVQWKWLQGEAQFTTVASTDEYTISSDISDDVDMIYNIFNADRVLRPLSARAMDQFDASPTATGTPTYYYEWSDKITLYPIPDSAVSHTVRYLKKVTELTDDTDIPLIPDEFQEILVVGAMMLFYEYDEDYSRFDRKVYEYNRLLDDMIAKNSTDIDKTSRLRLAKNYEAPFSNWDYQR